MAKKPKRELSVILDDIDAVLKSDTANIICVGKLLIEAKAQVDHGQWLPLLEQRFDFSERTARNYIKAAKYANRKSATIADLKISPSVLYALAGGQSTYLEVEDRILKAAETERVDEERAHEIWKTWLEEEQQKEANPESESDPGNQPRANNQDYGDADNVIEPDPSRWTEQTPDQAAEEEAAELSNQTLSRFKSQCDLQLPLMNSDDLEAALGYAQEIAEQCRSRLRESRPEQAAAA
jgi:hypothetical protein